MAAAAGVALEVFGLFLGTILGIVDLVLPPPGIPTDFLSQGHSRVRVGVGLNSTSKDVTPGGTIPSIQIFNENRARIGQAVGSMSHKVGEGAFVNVPVFHNANDTLQQPTYLEITGGPDPICVAYVAQTWADGTQLGWLGDMGKFCGEKWYYSNLYGGTKNGSQYKPFCTWIGGPQNPGCFLTDGTQSTQNCTIEQRDPLFSSGFKIHIPDFGPVGKQNEFAVPANPTELCRNPKLEFYKTSQFQSRASSLRPSIAVKTLFFQALGLLSLTTSATAAAVQSLSTWKGQEEAQTSFTSSIVGSHHIQHSSEALCASSTSWGPDFVSFREGRFCDMSLKRTWPLCNNDSFTGCYDWSTHAMREGRGRKRQLKYSNILEWR